MNRSTSGRSTVRKYAVVFVAALAATSLWVGELSPALANGPGNGNGGGGTPTPPTTTPTTTVAPTTTTTTTTTLAPTTTQAPATTQAPTTTSAPTTTTPPTTSPSTPVISLKASATSVNEGDSSSGNTITFTVENRVNGTLTNVSSNTSITVTGSGLGNCGQGATAQLQSGPIRIDRNASSTTFTVTTCGDTVFEPNDESFTVSISVPSGFSLGKSSETITVVADDLTAANSSGSVDNTSFITFDVRDLVQAPAGSTFTVQFSQPAMGGTVATASNGFIAEFTPALGYSGTTSFIYTVTDSRSSKTASGTITVTVTAASTTTSSTVTTDPVTTDPNAESQNLAPIAPAGTYSTDNALTALVTIDLLDNASDDKDSKGDLTIELGPMMDANAGVISDLNGSTFTFKPFPDYVGEVTISYSLTDTGGLTTVSTITITVTRVPLVTVDDSLTVASGSTARISPLDNDRNLGLETLTISTSKPSKGTVTVTGGVVFYQHTGNAAKDDTDTFTYTIRNAQGVTLGTGTVNVSIQPNRGVIKIRDIGDTVLIDSELSSGNNNDPKICKAVVEATNLFIGTAYTLQILEQGGKNSVTTLSGLMPGSSYEFGSLTAPVAPENGLQVYIGDYLDKGASYKVTLTAEGSTDSISSKVFSTCPPPDTRIDDATIVEGDSGTKVLSFKISTTGWASYTTTATISELSGLNAAKGGPMCADGVDFIDPGPTEIQVVDGQPTSFDVTICSETVYEDDELFTVNLTSTNPDVNFLDPTATGTIENDEVITLTIGDKEKLELDSGSESLTFDITAYDNGNDPVDIDLVATISAGTNGRAATRGGACSTDIDFVTPETNPLSVTNGQHTFTVSVCGDSDYENGDETFQITLSVAATEDVYRPADVVVADATGTILEDDGVVLDPVSNDDGGSDNADASTLTLFNSPSSPTTEVRTYIVNVTNRTADRSFTVDLGMSANKNLNAVDWNLSDSTVTVGPGASVPVTIWVTAPHRSSLRDTQQVTIDASSGDDKTKTHLDLTIRRRLEVTANNAARKYLNRNPVFTMSYEGFINNDAPSQTALINGARNCVSAAQTAPVGTHTITCGGLNSTDLYDVVYLPGRLTIERRPVTVLATSFTRPQNQGNPTLTYTVVGVPESEIPGITCSTTANGTAGRFPITCQTSAVLSSNLDVTFVPGTMTVTPVETPTTTAPAPTTAPTTTPPTTTPPTTAATTSPSTTAAPQTQTQSSTPTTAPPSTLPGGGVVIEVQRAPDEQQDETPIETTDEDDIVDVKEGSKEIDTGGGDDKVSSGEGDDAVDGGEGADRIDTGEGDDEIDGGDGDDELVDFEGDNEMTGGGGDDKLVSGTAAGGTVDAGPGNDTFYKFVEREFDIDNSTELIGVENIIVVLFDCDQLAEYQALSTDELLTALNLESDVVPTVTIECRADPFTAPQLDINGEDKGLDLRLSDIFNGPSSDEYYMRKSFEEMVNIAWARVESQRPRFSNWIRQQGVDGVQTYCARTPFPCNPIKES